jgi:hypothetical protein
MSLRYAAQFADTFAVVPRVSLSEWTGLTTSVLYGLSWMFNLDRLTWVWLGEYNPCISAITALLAFPF